MTRKLLAINFGGIGDEILFLPVLASIKVNKPDTHITLLLEPRSKAIKDISNLIDELKLFDIKKRPLLPNDYLELLQILRNCDYDVVVSSGSSPLVACLLYASGIKERIGYDSGALSRCLLTHAIKLNKDQYASTMYHDLTQGLGLQHKQVMPQIQVPAENLAYIKNWLSEKANKKENTRTIVIHPGTSKLAIKKGIIKTWAADKWASLIIQFTKTSNIQVVLAGGPDDEQTIAQIIQELEKNKQFRQNGNSFISAYGITKSLADLAALILISDLLICADSAPMHVGVALNKQILALFGPTNPNHLLPVLPQCRYIKDISYSKKRSVSEGINIQPNTVYQSAVDLLQIVKVQ